MTNKVGRHCTSVFVLYNTLYNCTKCIAITWSHVQLILNLHQLKCEHQSFVCDLHRYNIYTRSIGSRNELLFLQMPRTYSTQTYMQHIMTRTRHCRICSGLRAARHTYVYYRDWCCRLQWRTANLEFKCTLNSHSTWPQLSGGRPCLSRLIMSVPMPVGSQYVPRYYKCWINSGIEIAYIVRMGNFVSLGCRGELQVQSMN